MTDVIRILSQIESGDPSAAAELLPLVYAELRNLASARLAREKPGQTLSATALVHEAYLRMVGDDQSFNDRRHFFRAAAEAMRRILIDRARRKKRSRHGGVYQRVPLTGAELATESPAEELLAMDEALERFSMVEPAKGELVKLRYPKFVSSIPISTILKVFRA